LLPQYKTILLAVDLSENSAYALRHAVSIAQQHGGKVHLVHALTEMEPAVLNYVSTIMGKERLAEYELQHKEEIRDQMLVDIHDFAKKELLDKPEYLDLISSINVHHGDPVFVTLDAGDAINADLIVIGNHSKGHKVRHAFLGSMAKRLLRKTLRPVLVVPLPTT